MRRALAAMTGIETASAIGVLLTAADLSAVLASSAADKAQPTPGRRRALITPVHSI